MKYIKSYNMINEMKLTPSSLISQILNPARNSSYVSVIKKQLADEEVVLNKLPPEQAAKINLPGDLIEMSKSNGSTPNEVLIDAWRFRIEKLKELVEGQDYRKLVLSDKSYKNLVNYKAPKDIRLDVLRSLPNRKDIIQLNPNKAIKYNKTSTFLSVMLFLTEDPSRCDIYFFCIDLITGLSYYDNQKKLGDNGSNGGYMQTLDKDQILGYEGMIENYYSMFITCVTYIELTDVTFDICYSNSSRGDIMKGTDLKNQLPYNVIQVNSHWNSTRVHIGDTFGVQGHWRLAPVGPAGNKKYKYVFIDTYEKTGIIKRKAGKDIHK